MSPLATQQNALVAALFSWPADAAVKNLADFADLSTPGAAHLLRGQRGLRAYQANGHALAERALLAAYPVVAQLLGCESFAALARALWHAHPPVRGDLTEWGGVLAAFLAHDEQLLGEPYLADTASLEWALHQCAGAADQAPQPGSLRLLTQHDPAEIQLQLAPACRVLQSGWPIVSIVNAHLMASPALALVGQKLRLAVAETALVWRQQQQPRCREAVQGEADLVQALLAGATLGQALAGAPALDVAAWLPMAVKSGLLLGVTHQISH